MFKQLFTWWNGTTPGTSFTLFRKRARKVGEDEQGNCYFEENEATGPHGRPRRWVIYHGVAEASRVPADWHGWLHHTFDEAPTDAPLQRKAFEKDHLPNMTGTPLAYHPKGSLAQTDGPQLDLGYEAWSPDEE